MKSHLLPSLATVLCLVAGVHAEPKAIDKIVDLLHTAETSPKPLPILEKAKETLKDYKAAPALPVGPRKQGAVKAEARDRKGDAMERINQAIEEAKAGHDPKDKITAAISDVRHLGAMRD